MISLEGRIARIEITLATVLNKLPRYIAEPLGKAVRENVEAMAVDAMRTIAERKDIEAEPHS